MRWLLAVMVLLSGCDEPVAAPRLEPEVTPEPDEPEEPEAPRIPEETEAMLEALGYVGHTETENPEQRGVTTHEGEAWPGLNLFSSRDRGVALLTDLEGEVVHRWEADGGRAWMHVEPLGDGTVLAITKDRDLAKHRWDSSVVWRVTMRAHHDLAVRDDGAILVLVRGPGEMDLAGTDTPVLTDDVVVLSPDGERLRTHPLLPLFEGDVTPYRRGRIAEMFADEGRRQVLRAGGIGDVLHTNSIEILAREIEGVAPAGAILLSFRATSRVAIVDAAFERVLWSWGAGELEGQHDATQLPNGNVLLFDNGNRRSASRALEVDPRTNEIVWEHAPEGLYSRLRGGAQRLPNDNVLITEADRGHAIEVTREGETVWELWNPDVRHDEEGRAERAILYRLNRFPREAFPPLEGAQSEQSATTPSE